MYYVITTCQHTGKKYKKHFHKKTKASKYLKMRYRKYYNKKYITFSPELFDSLRHLHVVVDKWSSSTSKCTEKDIAWLAKKLTKNMKIVLKDYKNEKLVGDSIWKKKTWTTS